MPDFPGQTPLLNPLHAVIAFNRVGVMGGGQLAGMMASAAKELGVELTVQTPHRTDPAVAIAAQAIIAPLENLEATAELAAQSQVITFENEFVDLVALNQLAQQGVCFRPSLPTLSLLIDKFEQRTCLQQLGLPVPQFAKITPDLDPVALGFNFPLVIKARRHGYDGQGTFIISSPIDLEAFWQGIPQTPDLAEQFLVEAFVPFEQELAIIAVRSLRGEITTYPVVETQQEEQVCRRVLVPAELEAQALEQAQAIAQTFLQRLEAVGIFGIELFLTQSGQVLVNEVAPRTHNSGHFTLDACRTSQFEQHLRAVCNLPLGATALQCPGAVMVNLLGFETSKSEYHAQREQIAKLPNTTVHWYGKSQSYPGRKLGHVTVLLDTPQRDQAIKMATVVEQLWYHC